MLLYYGSLPQSQTGGISIRRVCWLFSSFVRKVVSTLTSDHWPEVAPSQRTYYIGQIIAVVRLDSALN